MLTRVDRRVGVEADGVSMDAFSAVRLFERPRIHDRRVFGNLDGVLQLVTNLRDKLYRHLLEQCRRRSMDEHEVDTDTGPPLLIAATYSRGRSYPPASASTTT
jgi:hypothetical protein